MKNLYILFCVFVFVNITLFNFAQCKMEHIGDSTYSTSIALLGGGNSEANFSIHKKGILFFLNLEYDRGNSKKIELSSSTPLIFVLDTNKEIKLFPLSKSTSQIENEYFSRFATSLYPISIPQMEELSKETPKEINLYYNISQSTRMVQGKLIITPDSLNEQDHRQLLHYDWHYKRMIKILNCALENK